VDIKLLTSCGSSLVVGCSMVDAFRWLGLVFGRRYGPVDLGTLVDAQTFSFNVRAPAARNYLRRCLPSLHPAAGLSYPFCLLLNTLLFALTRSSVTVHLKSDVFIVLVLTKLVHPSSPVSFSFQMVPKAVISNGCLLGGM